MPITFIEDESTQKIVVPKPKEKEKNNEDITLQYIKHSYAYAFEGQFKSKNELFTSYMELKKHSLTEAQKKISSIIKQSREKVSLMTVRDSATGLVSLALSNEKEVSKVRLDMDRSSIPEKIWFDK